MYKSVIRQSSWIIAVVAAGFLLAPEPARAADPCPTAGVPGIQSILKFYGFDTARFATPNLSIQLGRIDFYGQRPLAACITDDTRSEGITRTLYWLVDEADHLLSWLPEPSNYLCLGDGSSDVGIYLNVVFEPKSHCGVTMYPLNYNGNQLLIYGGAGDDHIHGGTGYDVIYGGLGEDDVDEAGHGPSSVWGAVYGEENGDFLYGGTGNSSVLHGGVGNDQIHDAGGTGERLYGGSGNECCIFDAGHSFDVLSCGSGSDGVKSFAGTTSCDFTGVSKDCGAANWTCPR